MAKIVEDIVIVKFSRLVKDSGPDHVEIINNSIRKALEDAAQQLLGESVVVEIEQK
jgi:hypothetical protein